jgi:translation initiation factor 3 subunit C
MSKFFRQAGDSDSSEDSEDELMSSEDEAPQRPTGASTKPALASFLRGSSDSSSSDSDEESESQSDDDNESDEDRPQTRILSAVDRRLREMEGTGVVIENALKINDWVAISNGSCLRHRDRNDFLNACYRIRQACSDDSKTP